jgi:RHS repeat-associated protein
MKVSMKRTVLPLLSAAVLLSSVVAFGQTPGVHRFPMHTDSGPASWNTGTYQYDAAGNIVAIGPQAYTYDVSGRLVDAHVVGPDGASNQSFGFDPYGNLTSATKDTVATSISVTSGTNRLTYAAYDASGNVTSYQPPSSTVTYNYTYDGLNMVQKSADSASHQSIYVYTADDERIWTYDLSAGVSHWKIRDLDNKELRDYTDTGASTWTAKDYFYRGSLLLAAATPAFGSTVASQEHFSVDHLGTPRLITNANHEKLGFHTYYPFGQEWLSAGNDTESRKFTGHERDSDPAGAGNDVDYMHARYYVPNLGRFLSVDPVQGRPDSPQSWNRYSYVLNNPINKTDPDGRCTVDGENHGWLWCAAHRIGLTQTQHERVVIARKFFALEDVVVNGQHIDASKLSDKQVMTAFASFNATWRNAGPAAQQMLISTVTITASALSTLRTIDSSGAAPQGQKGGREFQNDGRGGGETLPKTGANGEPIKYREWDVKPSQPGVNRGGERIVTGSDGSAWYTNDHYQTFTKIR